MVLLAWISTDKHSANAALAQDGDGPAESGRERYLKGCPITGDELRAIKRYLVSRTDALPWLFIPERGQPLTRQTVNHLLAEAAARAGLPPVHPHLLRPSCGFSLAHRGYDLRLIQDYLGHRDPKHTVHSTRVAAGRFEGLWR